jgi:alkylated DNA nucleotide flippase Atl1
MIPADVLLRKHSEELRDMWQGKLLELATEKMARVVQSVLAHSYPDSIQTLLRVVYPGFKSIALPFFVSAGRIAFNGEIISRIARTPEEALAAQLGQPERCPWFRVFKNETEMTKEFRKLADAMRISDAERIEMFNVVKRWIVCDYRQPVAGPELDEKLAK